ncbi:MAG TPA: polysaccharide pyruvyl transferase family protein [Defluviitaleaceae bacterium]|uniref:Polysaccharide pyruvyl transferase n=2 Tax=Acetivibrio saccincola TaxID=1677857 RepID=A0A2K9ESR2_9FIRM|nr:Polysaccharide pyruvyl transferase [Acetivibrio saccincola]HOA79763.1 polysaccharide pyruvyl transferase family protein [Defluviitaleaceae bacterium]
MMRKIGIMTLNGYYNYGNRLQNYALQESLKFLGFVVETIINRRTPKKTKFIKRIHNLGTNSYKEIYIKAYNKTWRKIRKKSIVKRTENFKEFTLNYINETNYFISENNIPKNLSDRYDYFVTGSDQVWNPVNTLGSSIFFLTFAEKHKRIAYAPSFGVSEIKPEYKEKYKEWISEIPWLSVREDDGARIIKELTGRDAPVLVDPTLLLTKEKWLSIAKEAQNKPKGNYLLTYFLGGIPPKYKKQIKKIAKVNNLEVINLADIRDKETYRTGPSEFIDYINSCSVFCTDSFHGAVFSILFEKPFIVYERMGSTLSMFSRIETLLKKFKLESRKAENIKSNEDVFNIDFSHVPAILEAERKKSYDFLKEALNVKDGD